MRVFFAPIYDLDPAAEGAERRTVRRGRAQPPPRAARREPRDHPAVHPDPDPVPAPAPGFAEIVIRVKGVRTHVYSTHLDYRADPSIRAAQVADMLDVLADDRGPSILVGDFNAEPSAPELAPLWHTLRDAAPDAGPTYPAVAPQKRIDLITVSHGITVTGARTHATAASDHRPVVADLRLPRRGG